MQIPLKHKYRVGNTGKSYARNHSGNGARKKKKLGVGYSDPYDRTKHVLVLLPSGKKRFFHS
jgi:hypothetical protein